MPPSYLISLALLACSVIFIDPVNSYPTGAPLSRCGDMTPHHKVDPLDDAPPYEIQVKSVNDKNPYYNITITATDDTTKFKGFLIEARTDWDGETVGEWDTNTKHTKTIDCFDSPQSAVTHFYRDDSQLSDDDEESDGDDDDHKGFRQLTLKWTPPSDKQLQNVKFVATIVKSYHKIYLNVSRVVKLSKKRQHKPLKIYNFIFDKN